MTFSASYRAMVVRETEDQRFVRSIESCSIQDLPPGDLLIRVTYSSLNYKDALSASGNRGVTRAYPHTPGIDAAGVVEESLNDRFKPGDAVIVTSYDLGMNTPGGFGEYIRVPSDWVVPLPPGMTSRVAMMYGTAGLTAALSVYQLLKNGDALREGEILVTGATGGVGSLALAILSGLGYDTAAVNGRNDATDFLTALGAGTIISREEAADASKRPLLKSRWAGVVDAVGGRVLTTALRSARPYATVTCCGNVGSGDLSMTVYPFILRGINLVGIDSQNCPMVLRKSIWKKLAGPWAVRALSSFVREISLEDLDGAISGMLTGKAPGRSLVSLDK